MKIFEFDSPEAMKDGAVARQVDAAGNPVEETEDQQKARAAQESVAALAASEHSDDEKFEEDNHGLKFAIRPIKNFAIGRIEFPLEIVLYFIAPLNLFTASSETSNFSIAGVSIISDSGICSKTSVEIIQSKLSN